MCRLSLVLCFLFLYMYGGVFGGPSNSKNKRPPPPALTRQPPSPRTPTQVWCVAKSVSSAKLKEFIQEACGNARFGLDCSAIAVGRACYFKKNTKKQASYVLNLYFVMRNTCMAQYGTLTHKDPSEGGCRFPLINLNG